MPSLARPVNTAEKMFQNSLDKSSCRIPRDHGTVDEMEANTTEMADGAVRAKGTGAGLTDATKGGAAAKAGLPASSVAAARAAPESMAAGTAHFASAPVASAAVGLTTGASVAAGTAGSGTGAASALSSAGSVGSNTAGHATFNALKTLKVSAGVHLGGIVKTGAVAIKGSLVAKCLVVAGVSLAGVVVAAHTGDVSAAQATVSAVPTWTSGQSILAHAQAGLNGGGSGSAGIRFGF
jgi:hypothetical protein